MSSVSTSYEQHIDYEKHRSDKIPSTIGHPESLDAWRHNRMHAVTSPILTEDTDASWLTIGDSGADAHWLRKQSANVTCSSLSADRIGYLKQQGYLGDIPVEAQNAEHLDKPDGSVDYVYCKEAYHHFPRPAIGLYEMIRVARKGVVFLEPFDGGVERPFDFLMRRTKQILRKRSPETELFEDSGNFVYRLSTRETTKVATALQLHSIYWFGMSDFYVPTLCSKPTSDVRARQTMRFAIGVQDVLCRLGLMNWGRVGLILFKQAPSPALQARLDQAKFTRIDIPRNPYLAG